MRGIAHYINQVYTMITVDADFDHLVKTVCARLLYGNVTIFFSFHTILWKSVP